MFYTDNLLATGHMRTPRREHDQRVREVEHGVFSPVVFHYTDGMSLAATVIYKRLAALISGKRDELYSTMMEWIQCCLPYSFLRASIICIRSTRSSRRHTSSQLDGPLILISSEWHVPQ